MNKNLGETSSLGDFVARIKTFKTVSKTLPGLSALFLHSQYLLPGWDHKEGVFCFVICLSRRNAVFVPV
jgi:hypothetical protein